MPNGVYRKLLGKKKHKAQWFGAYPHISNNLLVEVRFLFSAGELELVILFQLRLVLEVMISNIANPADDFIHGH